SFEYRPNLLKPPPPRATMRRGGVTGVNCCIASILRSHGSRASVLGPRAARVRIRVLGGPDRHPPRASRAVRRADRAHARPGPGRRLAVRPRVGMDRPPHRPPPDAGAQRRADGPDLAAPGPG